MSPDSPCPSTQELEAFTEGRLTGGDLTRVLNHLSSCLACQEEFRRLSSKGDDSPRPANQPPAGKQVSMLQGNMLQGSVLGQYQLLEPVGGGGMGVVYKALHVRLRQVVALKTMTRAARADEQALARFQREMAALGGLIHPNIVRATDAGEADGWHYLVMEFVEGFDRNQLVKLCGPLRVADACELIRQAATGLQFIHDNKRVHRDLKPSNLMLTLDGHAKILDLGLALLHEDTDELTSSRQVMGTADFMAPEQARSAHEVDIRADLYSLGCTLYKLLTGTAPFSRAGPERARKLAAHAELPPPPLSGFRPDVAREVTTVVERLLAKDPADRFQQPSELAAALAGAAAGHDLVALAQLAQDKRAERSNSVEGVHRKETVPFHPGAKQPQGGKSTPTPKMPDSSTPKPRAHARSRMVVATGVAGLCLAAWLFWQWSHDLRQRTDNGPKDDGLPWPTDYPTALKDMSWGKPVALVDRHPWRALAFGEKFRGGNVPGGKTFQPLWCRRVLGRGFYYEDNRHLQLYADVPPSLTFMELYHDQRRRWYEIDIDLMSLQVDEWVGGCYVGWQQVKAGLARTYLLLLERGQADNRLWLAPVEVRWQRADQPEPIYPFAPIAQQKAIALRAPPAKLFNSVRIRATPHELSIAVVGGDSVTVAPVVDVRGSLGLWTQQGWAYCGRVLLTPLDH